MIQKKLLSLFLGLLLCVTGAIIIPQDTFAAEVSLSHEDIAKFIGEAAGDEAGYSVSSAGDVNNDGYDDVLIGAYLNDGEGDDRGAAYLIYGQSTALNDLELNDTSVVKFTGENTSFAGFSVSSAGDVNNDGYDDMLIGAWYSQSVYLVYGQADYFVDMDLSEAAVVQFTGDAGLGHFGLGVASAGDVNNDGYDDFLMGDNLTGAYLLYGQSTLFDDMTINEGNTVKFSMESAGDQVGYSSTSAGDVNNDGYDDMLIGARTNGGGGTGSGAAYLIYGQAATLIDMDLSNSSIIKFAGEAEDDQAGVSVSSAGDVNNDGYDDMLIGAHLNDGGGSDSGAAYLVYGQSTALSDISLGDSSIVKFTGEAASDRAGVSVATAGDVNNDGYDDMLIGANFESGGGAFAGASYLVYGQSAALSDTTLGATNILKFSGEAADDNAGYSVSSAGDVNNDGYADMLMGADYESSGGSEAGAAYLAYLNVDQDTDGTLGSDGILDGTDCNDNDSTVSEDQTYYADSDGDGLGSDTTTSVCSSTAPDGYADNSDDTNDSIQNNGVEIGGDSVDNDGDSEVDEVNTLSENGIHPEYGTYDPASQDAYAASVSKIEGAKNGRIKVTYKDNSVYRYNMYDIDTDSKTKVKSFNSKGYLVVLQPKGKKVALINGFTGEKLATKKLSDEKWKYIGLKIAKVQGKNVVLATTKKKDGTVKLSLVKVKLAEEAFKKLSQKIYTNGAVDVTKTKGTETKIQLRNSNSTTLKTYKVTEEFDLVE